MQCYWKHEKNKIKTYNRNQVQCANFEKIKKNYSTDVGVSDDHIWHHQNKYFQYYCGVLLIFSSYALQSAISLFAVNNK